MPGQALIRGRRGLDDEARAAARAILHPRPPTVEAGVLGHQRQTEAGSHPVARRRAAGEPLEDAILLGTGHARSGVLDEDPDPFRAALDADAHGTARMLRGVVEQVGDGPLQAALVDGDRALAPALGDLDGHVR